MACGGLFAITYQVTPEGQAEYDRIMWGFGVRAVVAIAGLVLAYACLRSRPPAGRSLLGWAAGVGLRLLVGAGPAAAVWCAAEAVGGEYWWWRAVAAGAGREVALGFVGWAGWSVALGHLLLASLGESRLEQPAVAAGPDGAPDRGVSK